MELVINAMNNSYMQRISEGKNIELIDMLLMFSKSLEQSNRYSLNKEGRIEKLKHYFKIV